MSSHDQAREPHSPLGVVLTWFHAGSTQDTPSLNLCGGTDGHGEVAVRLPPGFKQEWYVHDNGTSSLRSGEPQSGNPLCGHQGVHDALQLLQGGWVADHTGAQGLAIDCAA